MITDKKEMFEKVLIEPALKLHCDTLKIVSGFVSPMILEHTLETWKSKNLQIKIDVIVGMTPTMGILSENHDTFIRIIGEHTNCTCSYIQKEEDPCHSKLYVWLRNNQPVIAFEGSANYTQIAFFGNQQEILEECNAKSAYDYYNSFCDKTIFCNHNEIESAVQIMSARWYKSKMGTPFISREMMIDPIEAGQSGKGIILSLLSKKTGDVGVRSGLNWGQRGKRNKDEAYIAIPKKIVKARFFPPRTMKFNMITDDSYSLICVVAQDEDKAIQTSLNNSELGRYFRRRLKVPDGAFVTKEDLLRYGRTTVEITKIDEETFFMDFSVNDKKGTIQQTLHT